MQRVVIAVRRQGEAAETDFEVPTDVGAAHLADQLAAAVGAPAAAGQWELRSVMLGRALRPDETLAEAGVWDGAMLVLARAREPMEARPRGGALAVADAPTRLAVLPTPAPPVLALPPIEQPRSLLPYVVAGIGLLVVVAAGASAWWFNSQRPEASAAVASAPPAAATVEAPPPRASTQTVAASPSPNEEAAWRDLLARLEVVWGDDWQASIALLQAFHAQYPTRVAATDKLYAGLVEYGRALRAAGDSVAAAEQFQQAVRLQPQRIEARAELAAMAPEPTPTSEPTAVPEPQVVVREPPPAPVATPRLVPTAPPPPPPPAPVEQPAPGCDVRSVANACPLGDGSHVQDTIAAPAGRHYYWFGVPVPGMHLRVRTSGSACPCGLAVFSDQVDDGQTPIATADGDLEVVMADPGPYVIELAPAPDAGASGLDYALDVGLDVMAPAASPAEPAVIPVAVPPVVARSATEASNRVRTAGLDPRLQTADRYSPGGVGAVAAQDPPAGTTVAPGSQVTLLIASGNVVVPNVTGLPEQQAEATLRAAGLGVTVRRARTGDTPAGTAARTDPAADSLAAANSQVTLIVSLGP